MTLVTCPCCHGETQLAIYEPTMVLAPTFLMCCHCQGKGEIESEVSRPLQNPLGPIAGHSEFINELQELAARQARPVSWLETWRACFRWRP